MDELQILLLRRIQELTTIIKAAKECMESSPEGSLLISGSHAKVQYYQRTKATDTHGTYIKKSEVQLIHQLAQKDYAKKIYGKAIKEREELTRCMTKYDPEALFGVYNNLLASRKELVDPYILSQDDYITAWKERKQKEKARYGKNELLLLPEEEAIFTEQGERVRSKSEKILADKLYMMHIPYIYECPLYAAGYGYLKPDFTVLNYRTRQEYIWEHLGMMDNKEYLEKAIKKIETYGRNQIYSGRQLILTYETEHHPLNIRFVEGLIKEYLL
ncbi:MAG: hypothetical protein Q4G58_05025 [bacterium]|nr:hypothetical protein [bacterium]